ncbi:MAG: mechanosensitive ion channel family protein [Pirellulaceae bacterium]|nr:mechanosensitive ion channel family protein [Pirellulaceae bacterium]
MGQVEVPTMLVAAASTEWSFSRALSQLLQAFQQGDFSQGAITLLDKIVLPASLGLLSLLAAYFVSKLISTRVKALICSRVDETLGKFIGKLTFYGLLLVFALTICSQLNIEISAFMAMLATAGFAIGLAFQGTLSNFSAGVLLLVFRPFKVGDLIGVAGVIGKVNEIDIFTTTLDTTDNRRLILPNSSIAGNTIENMTHHAHRRVDVVVSVELAANLDQTRKALTECVESISQWIIPGEDRGSQVLMTDLGQNLVQWTVRMWVAKENFFIAKELLLGQIKRHLDQYAIGIARQRVELQMSAQVRSSLTTPEPLPPTSLAMPNLLAQHDSQRKIRPRTRGEGPE